MRNEINQRRHTFTQTVLECLPPPPQERDHQFLPQKKICNASNLWASLGLSAITKPCGANQEQLGPPMRTKVLASFALAFLKLELILV